jgi:hypothetical protein
MILINAKTMTPRVGNWLPTFVGIIFFLGAKAIKFNIE